MSFYEKVRSFDKYDFDSFFGEVTDNRIMNILSKEHINEEDFLCLLSPKAEGYIEEMAQKAHGISLNHFGKSILLYTPMYLANYCVNKCVYCGYNVHNKIKRKKLAFEEVEIEAQSIYNQGFRHILILTGESRYHTPVSYIKECVKILRKYFSSIGIEIYPLEEVEYAELIEAGVDSLTIYQEVYDEAIYKEVHIDGPKADYKYRLNAPERACKAHIHSLGIGALLGLNKWRQEAFFTGLHAAYIQRNYPEVEITLSTPRMRPHAGSYDKIYEVTDKNLVQTMLSYKIFLHRVGLNITTRERAEFRDNLIPLGVTKMSAGVSTNVGGHATEDKGEKQFEIADGRNIEEIKRAISATGYNPIIKDWQCLK